MKKDIDLHMTKTRSNMIDNIKGIGILSIVIGHGSYVLPNGLMIGPFVYSYHLMIFLFVAGFCYNEEKYKDDILSFMGTKVWRILPVYFLYNAVFVIAHNFLVVHHFISSEMYDTRGTLVSILQGLTLQTSETLLGTFWFLGMFLFAEIIFGIFIYMSNKTGRCFHLINIVFSIICGVLGLYLVTQGCMMNYHIQVSILAIPFMYLGFYIRRVWEKVCHVFTWYGCIGSMLVLYYMICYGQAAVDLSANLIDNPKLFYLSTMIGIYFCVSLARIIERIPGLRKVMAFAGKNSFHIMAMHFVFFKLFDGVYGRINNMPAEVFSIFPHSFDLWYVYYVVGFVGPLALCFLMSKVRSRLTCAWNGLRKENSHGEVKRVSVN